MPSLVAAQSEGETARSCPLCAPVLDTWASVSGRWSFALSIGIGFLIGVTLPTAAGSPLAGALISLGALGIAAMAAYQGLARRNEIEQLQQRLQDEASYHAFVDAALEGFFRTTRDGRYLIVNPALARIYGYDSPEQLRAELTNIGDSLYVDPARRTEFERQMNEIGFVNNFVSQIRRRDGSVIWISENARTVKDADDQFLFYEGTCEDISLERASEEAMRHALLETQDASRAKAAFLAAMSHELKTPLNAVIGFSDVMRQELFGKIEQERYRGYVVDIHDNGRKLLRMINDILDLSRVEGKLLDLDDDSVNVEDAVTAACNAVTGDKPDAPPVHIEIPSDLPLLRVDPRRLRQVLTHLMANAIKFTPADGHVTVRAGVMDDGAFGIAIADTGIGIHPDRIGHALEPFKQLDGRLARRFDGVGLGLPLANALVKAHDGALSIQSAPGAGTTVTVRFPPERIVEVARAACA